MRDLTPAIAVLSTEFPENFPHDPADRLIAATARAEGITLVDQRWENTGKRTCENGVVKGRLEAKMASKARLNPDSAVKPTSPQAQGGTLEKRRRPTVKFRSFLSLALRCYRAEPAITEPLIDVCLEAVTYRLRYGRVSPCATLSSATAESGLKRKSYFVDERTLSRAKKAPRVKTEAEVIRSSVERVVEMEEFWELMKKTRRPLKLGSVEKS